MKINKKLIFFGKYGDRGASTRVRIYLYSEFLKKANFTYVHQTLLDDQYLDIIYSRSNYLVKIFILIISYFKRIFYLYKLDNASLIFIEKELFPYCPAWLELRLLGKKKFILDYDDATFHFYDNHPNRLIRWLYREKIGNLMSHSSMVLAGNQYLYSYAVNSGAKNVTIFPSVIDLDSYCFISSGQKVIEEKVAPFYIVWVGSPSTEKYLNLLSFTLKKISKKYNLILRVISYQSKLTMEGVNIEHIEWSESTALKYISSSDIGIMPLTATPWDLGKCGYKLIQYMGCSLPVIATKVGANVEIVNDGVSGFLVNSLEEWESAFYKLMDSRLLREQMGRAGRLIVEDRYCSQVSGKKLIKLLLEI